METKITLTTSEVEDHVHERFFEDGTISAGTYETSETNGHTHFFVVSEDVAPGSSVTVQTSPPDGDEDGHQHSLTVRAIEEESGDMETEGMGDDEKATNPCDEKGKAVLRDVFKTDVTASTRGNPDGSHTHTFEVNPGHASPMETKSGLGRVIEAKEITRDGVRLGIIEALIATWEEDTGGVFGVPDRFERGAFADSIIEHRARSNRQVRLKDHHGRTIGGFPIETVRETSAGLFGVGEINLETQQGAEAWALIKQGVLVDMSVGFSALEDEIVNGIRVIRRAILWEGSVVDEPANRGANILAFKSTPFADLPIAPVDTPWDPVAANARVKSYADLSGIELKSAFVQETPQHTFGLQVADVIEGKLQVIPAALKDAAANLIDQEGADELVEHVERYFAKMGADSPFPASQRKFFGAGDVREWKAQDVERALLGGARFSKGAAKVLASRLTGGDGHRYDAKAVGRILNNLEAVRRELESK